MTEHNLDDLVVRLDFHTSFKLPMSVRPTDKLVVVDDSFYVVDQTGPLRGFDLAAGQEILYSHGEPAGKNCIDSLATDGSRVYMYVRGGNFTIAPEDILVAKYPHADRDDEHRDALEVPFIGKSVSSLDYMTHRIYARQSGERQGIQGRVVSVPITSIPLLIFDIGPFNGGRPRMLVHDDMHINPKLYSGNGFMALHYGSVSNATATSAVLTENGDIHYGPDFFDERVKKQPTDVLSNLHFFVSHGEPGISAEYNLPRERDSFEHDEENPRLELELNKAPSDALTNVMAHFHYKDELHILHRPDDTRDSSMSHTIQVNYPARLDSYKIRIRQKEER